MPNFATGGTEPGFAGEGDYSFFITRRTDVTSVTTLRVTAAHHFFDRFLHVGSLVGRYLFPPTIPPLIPVVDKYLPKPVAAILRGCLKQQDCRRSIGDNGQHSLASVDVDM